MHEEYTYLNETTCVKKIHLLGKQTGVASIRSELSKNVLHCVVILMATSNHVK
jgi:hypothetical protein